MLPRAGARDRLRGILTYGITPGKDVQLVVLRKDERMKLSAKWDK